MKHQPLTLFVGLAMLGACGGRVVEQPGSGGYATTEQTPDEPEAPAAAGRTASPSAPLPTHALGDCTPGFSRAGDPSRPCHWLTKAGICFDHKELACNCICPATGDSVCFSGFDGGPASATLVQCM